MFNNIVFLPISRRIYRLPWLSTQNMKINRSSIFVLYYIFYCSYGLEFKFTFLKALFVQTIKHIRWNKIITLAVCLENWRGSSVPPLMFLCETRLIKITMFVWFVHLQFVDHDFAHHKNDVRFGICIPDSCTAQDLEISLQKEFDKRFLPHRVKAEVQIESILCSTDKDIYPFDTGYYFTR